MGGFDFFKHIATINESTADGIVDRRCEFETRTSSPAQALIDVTGFASSEAKFRNGFETSPSVRTLGSRR